MLYTACSCPWQLTRLAVYIIRSIVPLEDSVDQAVFTRARGLKIPENMTIVDFRYLDDKSLLVLCSQPGTSLTHIDGATAGANTHAEEPRWILLRFAYNSTALSYDEYTPGRCPSAVAFDESIGSCVAFSHMSGFAPLQMEVHKASNLRGDMPARICLLGSDRSAYRIYALPEGLDEGERQP